MWRFITAYWLSYLITNLLILGYICAYIIIQATGAVLDNYGLMFFIKIVLHIFLIIFIMNIGLFMVISLPIFLILRKYSKLKFLYFLSWSMAIGLINGFVIHYEILNNIVPFFDATRIFAVIGGVTGLVFWGIYKWLTKAKLVHSLGTQ